MEGLESSDWKFEVTTREYEYLDFRSWCYENKRKIASVMGDYMILKLLRAAVLDGVYHGW